MASLTKCGSSIGQTRVLRTLGKLFGKVAEPSAGSEKTRDVSGRGKNKDVDWGKKMKTC